LAGIRGFKKAKLMNELSLTNLTKNIKNVKHFFNSFIDIAELNANPGCNGPGILFIPCPGERGFR